MCRRHDGYLAGILRFRIIRYNHFAQKALILTFRIYKIANIKNVSIGGSMVQKRIKLLILLLLAIFVVASCSSKTDEVNGNNEIMNENTEDGINNEVDLEETNDPENEETNDENVEDDESAEGENDEEEEEEPTFADEVRILEVDKVLYDQEEVELDTEEFLIEHERIKYVDYETISEWLDYEIKLDPESSFAEILEGKEDYTYEAAHQEEGGALLDVGEIYVDSLESYVDPEGDDTFDFIEFNEKLYVPERILEIGLHTPINYIRKDRTLEFGIRSEPLYLNDLKTNGSALRGNGGLSSDSKHATIQGEKYEVVAYKDRSVSKERLAILADYKQSLLKGIFYNKHEEDLEFVIMAEEKDELLRVTVGSEEVEPYEVDISGVRRIDIEIDSTSSSIFDRFSFAIYSEFY